MTEIPTDRHITYQTCYVTCGQLGCHCHTGRSRHGPYLYAIWRQDNGKQKKVYVGKPEQTAKVTPPVLP